MEMLHYDFMQRAFCAGGLIALLASALGVYLLLRRQALMADMLSHVSLAGIAGGAYFQVNPTMTGFLVAVCGAVVVEYLRRAYRTYSEISVAIIMVGGLSLSVILMSLNKSINISFSSYLFGSVVAVNRTELIIMLATAVIGALFFYFLRRPLYLISFDEETARTNGIPVPWISLGFSILTGMIVAAAMPIVGVLLVSSLIVLPASLAIRISPSFSAAIFISMGIGLLGVFTGLTASYELSTPPGGTIAFVLLTFLVIGITVKKTIHKLGAKARMTAKQAEMPVTRHRATRAEEWSNP
ncbi:metal ABC transporter permease [Cohnella thailandensis]|uniref:Metal ABC transporter permease n=1 Tax=Cohnella thailandensis TaxID=557557 RepID=A0A841STH3_9BACL|nr:metal ABC transporter permease [Cohnella thailandensis]MBB6633335.1 metal ABC transporter permease [Cohnella thailandensis]MBP1977323.1 zinc transport system permease protein [Cohnella thailandensis]